MRNITAVMAGMLLLVASLFLAGGMEAADPLQVFDVEGMRIGTTRSDELFGWEIRAVDARPAALYYGGVFDKLNVYSDAAEFGCQSFALEFDAVAEPLGIQAGDWVEMTYQDCTPTTFNIRIFLPAGYDGQKVYVDTGGALTVM